MEAARDFARASKAPIVGMALQGLARALGAAPDQKAPVLVADLRRMVAALPVTLLGTRDPAVLLLGFAGAFRRSELVALDVEDLVFAGDGFVGSCCANAPRGAKSCDATAASLGLSSSRAGDVQ